MNKVPFSTSIHAIKMKRVSKMKKLKMFLAHVDSSEQTLLTSVLELNLKELVSPVNIYSTKLLDQWKSLKKEKRKNHLIMKNHSVQLIIATQL
jgi:hypothetical protein